jgi:hypothetical protein
MTLAYIILIVTAVIIVLIVVVIAVTPCRVGFSVDPVEPSAKEKLREQILAQKEKAVDEAYAQIMREKMEDQESFKRDVTWGDWSESDSSDENKPNDGLTYNR